MAYWTVIGKGNAGETEGKAFGLTLNTDQGTWIANGPDVDYFFTSKSGKYSVIVDATYGKGTQLKNTSEVVAGFLENLTGETAVGDGGNGYALEKGETFRWTLDSK
jgi:hypothetical protein